MMYAVTMIELKIPTIRDAIFNLRKNRAEKKLALYGQGKYKYKDSELTYAAYSRCPCGAGLADPRGGSKWSSAGGTAGYWDCSDILKGEAWLASEHPGEEPVPSKHYPAKEGWDGKHTDKLPFMFYEIKSEHQPSANGRTTRPDLPMR